MKNNKLIFTLLGLFALLIIVAVVGKKAGWIGKGNIPEVAVEKAEKRTVTETVTASGKINPQTEVKLSSEVSGEVIQLYVKEGDSVKKGTLLCVINPAIYESVVIQASASMNQTKANLASARANEIQMQAAWDQAKRNFERNKKLYQDKVISEAEYEAAKLQYDQAGSNYSSAAEQVNAADFTVKNAAAQLQQAQDNLLKTKIYAPISGIVSLVNVKLGERVVGTAQMAGTEIIRVADLDNMQAEVDVNENDVLRISVGDTAEVEIDAYPKKKFKAVVSQISYSATNSLSQVSTSQATNFTVKMNLLASSYVELVNVEAGRKYPFRPGMSATVDIKTEQRTDVLTVPIQSVTTREQKDLAQSDDDLKRTGKIKTTDGGKDLEEIVFVVVNGKAVAKKVSTGIQNTSHIEIIAGVQPGDEIVKAPFKLISKTLNDGDMVKVVDESALFSEKEE